MKLRYPLIAILIFGSPWAVLAWQNFPTISLLVFFASNENQELEWSDILTFASFHQALVDDGQCDAAAKLHYLAHIADNDAQQYLDFKSIVPGKCSYEQPKKNQRVAFVLNYSSPVPWEDALQKLIDDGNCKDAASLSKIIDRANEPRIVFFQTGEYDNKNCENELKSTLDGNFPSERQIANSYRTPFSVESFKSGMRSIENSRPFPGAISSVDHGIDEIASEILSTWLETTCFGYPNANSPVDYESIAKTLKEPYSNTTSNVTFNKWITNCENEALQLAYRFRDGDGVPQSELSYLLWAERYGPKEMRREFALERSLVYLYFLDPVPNLVALQNETPGFDKDSFPAQVKFGESEDFSSFELKDHRHVRNLEGFSDLYNLANEDQFAPAQLKLAEFYANGEWVEQSDTEAYGWLLRAERNGAEGAELRDQLEARLSPEKRKEIENNSMTKHQDEMVETGD